MRLLPFTLWTLLFSCPLKALIVGVNQPCDKDRDILLLEDPEGNSGAFLQCHGMDIGTFGVWKRKFCPNEMLFDFVNQQCQTGSRKRKTDFDAINIAILNNSCARGERCIGGTVCDPESLKCLCPYGTIADVSTLSCVEPVMTFKSYAQTVLPNQYGQTQTPIHSITSFLRPSPVVPNVDSSRTQYIQQSRSSITASVPLPTLVPPGSSCGNGETCGGGSLCTLPLKVCLCPGKLEDYGGECVLPKFGLKNTIIKVGLGSTCGDLAECDHDSSCVDGRCQCVPPLVQHEGRCFLRRPVKKVGPGELCDNGQICTRGSVCDAVIPICICPPEWDLDGDSCVRTFNRFPSLTSQPVSNSQSVLLPQLIRNSQPMPQSQLISQPQPMSQPHQISQPQPIPQAQLIPQPQLVLQPQTIPQPHMTSAPPSYFEYTNPPRQTTPLQSHSQNINSLMHLGGSKQVGVGEKCSVNTDCMIGAYCKSSTAPPSCQCLSTHVNVNGRCEKVIYPGQTGCQHDVQCTTAFTGTKCIDRECVCPEGYKAVEQTCVSGFGYPGTACNKSAKMIVCSARSVCIDSLCRCPSSLIQYRMRCFKETDLVSKKTKLFSRCKTSMDCMHSLICLRGKCSCRSGTSWNGSGCHDIKKMLPSRTWNKDTRSSVSEDRPKRGRKKYSIDNMDCWPDQYMCANGNGICLNQTCHCIDGYRRINEHCEKIYLPIDSPCDSDSKTLQCEPNAKCIQGHCVCNTGNECYEKQGPLSASVLSEREFCLSDEDCGYGSTCINSFCRCSEGFFRKGDSCTRRLGAFKPINSQCMDDDRCIGGSKCVNSICSCRNRSTNIGGKCYQEPGGNCADGQFCTGGSSCELAVCRCPPGKLFDRNRCISKVVLPGNTCEAHQKCSYGSFCRFGICMCSAGFRIIDGRCEKLQNFVIGINSSSESPEAANTVVTESTWCNSSLDKYAATAAPGQCCNENTNCLGGSSCSENMCICPESTKLVGIECIIKKTYKKNYELPESYNEKSKIPGSTCRLTIDCPYRTECIRGLCRCKQGETIVNDICRKAISGVLPGNKCDPGQGLDCIGESHCVYGKCACKLGLSDDGRECVSQLYGKDVFPGDSCREGQVCSKGSLCINNICQCRDIEIIDDEGNCVLSSKQEQDLKAFSSRFTPRNWKQVTRGLEEPNQSLGKINQYLSANQMSINVLDENLYRLLLSGEDIKTTKLRISCKNRCEGDSYCSIRDCVCPTGYEKEGSSCILVGKNDKEFIEKILLLDKLEKGRATKNYLVNPTGSEFSMGAPPNGQKYSFVYPGFPGGKCGPEEKCFNGARCNNNQCVCDQDYFDINGVCRLASVHLGGECEINEQCSANAKCENKFCQCKEGFVQNEQYCIPVSLTTKDCEGSNHCTVVSKCDNENGDCCPSGMVNDNGECRYITVGHECYTNANCNGGSAICYKGHCTCDTGYKYINGNCVSPSDNNSPLFPKTDFGSSNDMSSDYEDGSRTISQDDYFNGIARKNIDAQNQMALESNGFHLIDLSGMNNIWPGEGIHELTPFVAPSYHAFNPSDVPHNFYTFPMPNLTPSSSEQPVWQGPFAHQYPINTQPYLPFGFLPIHLPIHASTTVNKTITDEQLKERQDEICMNEMKCYEDPICNGTDCACPTKYILLNGRCILNIQKRIKQISNGQIAFQEQLPSPLQSCSKGESCTGNSYCTFIGDLGPLCICPLATVLIGKQCILMDWKKNIVEVGGFCLQSSLCVGGSVCVNQRCICPLGQTKFANFCLRTALPGEWCDKDRICTGHSVCDKRIGKCLCNIDSTVKDGKCTVNIENQTSLNRSVFYCERRNSCPDNSFCSIRKVCQCFKGYKRINGHCVPFTSLRYPGENCDDTSFCTGESRCSEGKCRCLNGENPVFHSCRSQNLYSFWERSPIKRRLRKRRRNEQVTAPPGGSCYNSEECTGGSICRSGWCICPDPTMIVTRGLCIKAQTRQPQPSTVFLTAQPYYPQTKFEHNSLSYSSITPSPTTRMASSYTPYSSKNTIVVRKAAPGTNCGPLDECVGGSMCIEGVCICPAGFKALPTTGRCEPNSTTKPPSSSDYTGDYASSVLTQHIPSVMPSHTQSLYTPTMEPHSSYKTSEEVYPPYDSLLEKVWSTPLWSSSSETTAQTAPPTRSWHLLTTRTVVNVNQFAANNKTTTLDRLKTTTPADECVAVGLYCRGGTVCINLSCQCPPGFILHNDQCVPPPTSTKRRGKSWSRGPHFAKPNEPCRNGETCTGGSICTDKKVENTFDIFDNRKTCLCPVEKPIVREDTCIPSNEKLRLQEAEPGEQCDSETRCTDQSICYQGMCRCQTGYAAISGKCVKLPAALSTAGTAPPPRSVSVAPGQQCIENQQCRGGSNCVDGVCQCANNEVIYNDMCMNPTTVRLTTPSKQADTTSYLTSSPIFHPSTASLFVNSKNSGRNECEDDTQCGDKRICIVGRCKCKSGFVERDGSCVQIDEIDYSDQHIPIQATISTQRRTTSNSRKLMQTVRTPRPRITGPPLKRPRPADGYGNGGNKLSLKTRSGNGVCPPGNEPARDESTGKIIVCNGIEPNCPPRSYCYVTGYAMLHRRELIGYGNACDLRRSYCLQNAACIDGICKCRKGELLSENGICQSLEELKENMILKDSFFSWPKNYLEVNNKQTYLQKYNTPYLNAIEPNTHINLWPSHNMNSGRNQSSQPYWTMRLNSSNLQSSNVLLPASYNGSSVNSNIIDTTMKESYLNPSIPRTVTSLPLSSPQFTTPTAVTIILTLPTVGPEFENVKRMNEHKKLGERCDLRVDNCPEFAQCILHVCVCLPGYEPGNGRCSLITENDKGPKRNKYRAFGETCRLNEECEVGDCVEGRCECTANKTLVNGSCVNDWEIKGVARPGESCVRGRVCSGGSVCDRDVMKCICAAEHWIDRGVCVTNAFKKIARPGEKCSSEWHCSGNSRCLNGTCQCDDRHYPSDGYCRPITAINGEIKLTEGGALKFSSNNSAERPLASRCPVQGQAETCKLPKCFCTQTGKEAPGGLQRQETPQFVVLTFDDAINGKTLPDYRSLFGNNTYVNPNGCPFKGTFFVSHEWTNYNGVQWLYDQGHELASNSITHVSLQGKSMLRWLNEMDGERRIMAKFGNANEEEIDGIRAPELALGGNQQFEMMLRAGFLYDNSIPAKPGLNEDPYWPQTLDYTLAWPCLDKHCPIRSFPGIWEIPLNQFYYRSNGQTTIKRHSSMLRAAVDLNATVDELYELLVTNFEKPYFGNRAPYVLTLTADFLQLNAQNTGMHALRRFLDRITMNKDVYIVTIKQLIQWMQDPVPLSRIYQSFALRCSQGSTRTTGNGVCANPNKCMYRTPDLNSPEHQFLTCNPCPELYPWLENPVGKLRL